MEFEWEEISKEEKFGESLEVTLRAKVIGGWLVRVVDVCTYKDVYNFGFSSANSMTFISDPNHEWSVE